MNWTAFYVTSMTSYENYNPMENIASINTEEHYLPKIAIVGYERTNGYYNSENYFSFHKIVAGKFSAGMPLTKDTARNIFSSLESELFKFSFKGILPKNLIYFNLKGNLNLIWYNHPKQYQLYFDGKTGIESGKYPMPKLLFFLKDNCLRVFALHRADMLDNETPIYNAPMLNINSGGKVCMGTASINYDGFEFYEDIMGYVEQQFFRSVFTESHHQNLVKGNIVKVMKALRNTSKFDDALLQKNSRTLNELYEN